MGKLRAVVFFGLLGTLVVISMAALVLEAV
jgi:hypothetical protein